MVRLESESSTQSMFVVGSYGCLFVDCQGPVQPKPSVVSVH